MKERSQDGASENLLTNTLEYSYSGLASSRDIESQDLCDTSQSRLKV